MENKKFPKPKRGSVFYNDRKIRVCLATDKNHVEGRTIIEWKKDVEDLNKLSLDDYQYLMKIIFVVRKALLEAYKTDKVYLAYIDEGKHVHWHLFPRKKCSCSIKGFLLMAQEKEDLSKRDLKKVPLLRSLVIKNLKKSKFSPKLREIYEKRKN